MEPEGESGLPAGATAQTGGVGRFSITHWAAWAPGLETSEAWRRWARGEVGMAAEGEPVLQAVPPMLRRRVGRLGRMALTAACGCGETPGYLPTVFCSRHGELRRALDLFLSLSREEPLSPATFSLSVHNAIGALLSIASGSRAPVTAIAAGAGTVPSGVLEACGMLAAGEPEVLLVAYDEPLPAPYHVYRDEEECAYAWAWRMTSSDGHCSLLPEVATDTAGPSCPAEPLGLEILRCFLSGVREQTLRRGRRTWRWRRHA